MTYTVRRLQVDLDTPWPRHWAGGDAFRSAWFNALSFSFPAGEQLFIDAVKMGAAKLDGPARERFADEVHAFIGQEATHRRIHQRFNAQLEAQGYVNTWEGRIRHRIATQLAGQDPRVLFFVTASTEIFTAILAEWLLTNPAFDLYHALGGNLRWRRRLYVVVTLHFAADVMRQTLANLRRDGHWWRPATWAGAWRLLLGRGGLLRATWRPWKRYFAADFHPDEGNGAPAAAWLAAHAELAPPVRTASPATGA